MTCPYAAADSFLPGVVEKGRVCSIDLRVCWNYDDPAAVEACDTKKRYEKWLEKSKAEKEEETLKDVVIPRLEEIKQLKKLPKPAGNKREENVLEAEYRDA